MEEEALHKVRRLTDYYDVHEEIGRYGAASMGVSGAPRAPQGQECWSLAAPWHSVPRA